MRSRITVGFVAMLSIATLSVVLSPASVGAQIATTCAGEQATIVGTNGDDVLRGTPGRDVIVGNGGDDQIFGAAGNDIICGNAGGDLMQGGAGADLIIGGFGPDRLVGGGGNDDLRGGPGNDEVVGKFGADTLRGDAGVDRIVGNLGVDTCFAQWNDEFITGCEDGNVRTRRGTGDGVAIPPEIPTNFRLVRHCLGGSNTDCDDYYAAQIQLDGTGTFDALSVTAFDASGETIATYSTVGDTMEGTFLFKGLPARLEVDSGGGPWGIVFMTKFALPKKRPNASGVGNMVYQLSTVNPRFGNVTTSWTGFGNFAAIGVSPSQGRDLFTNEVRFAGGDTPPFTATATAQAGITFVQVLSNEGTWRVQLAS